MAKTAARNGAMSELPFDLGTEEGKKAWIEKLCDDYNKTEGNLNEDGYDCRECRNKGFINVPEQDARGNWYELQTYCKCQKIRGTIRRLNKSGLKNIIKDYTFKNYKDDEPWQKAIKDAAMRFVKDEDHTWFFIGGSSGAGKTHICTAIAGYYLRREKSVKYMLWRDEAVKLKACVTDEAKYSKMIDELKNAEVLYIDDLFKTGKDDKGNPQRPTPADINIAFEILNFRYNNPKLVTIISSECRVTDILDIDEAIGGRIAEKASNAGYGINIKPDTSKNYRLRGLIEL